MWLSFSFILWLEGRNRVRVRVRVGEWEWELWSATNSGGNGNSGQLQTWAWCWYVCDYWINGSEVWNCTTLLTDKIKLWLMWLIYIVILVSKFPSTVCLLFGFPLGPASTSTLSHWFSCFVSEFYNNQHTEIKPSECLLFHLATQGLLCKFHFLHCWSVSKLWVYSCPCIWRTSAMTHHSGSPFVACHVFICVVIYCLLNECKIP